MPVLLHRFVPGLAVDLSTFAPRALLGAIVAFAAWRQFAAGLHPDIVWLLIVGERWLDGETLYVDLLETNPPASVYLYAPAIMIARALAVASESAVIVLTFALFAISLALSWSILRPTGVFERFHADWLAPVLAGLFLAMPAMTFAQREHLALILILPAMALAAARACDANSDRAPRRGAQIAGGLAAGLAVAIKPTLALTPVFLSLTAAWRRRSWRPLFAGENWIGAGLVALYFAAALALHPAFLRDMTPFLRDLYFPAGQWIIVLILPTFHVLVALWACARILRGADLTVAPYCFVYAAAAGFSVSYVAQMKFFDYHAMPVAVLLMLAIVLPAMRKSSRLPDRRSDRVRWPAQTIALAIAGLCAIANFWLYAGDGQRRELALALREIHPAPRVVAFSAHLGEHVPAVREAGGVWVGSFGAALAPVFADWMRRNEPMTQDRDARLAGHERRAAEIFARDLARKTPDVLLVAVEGGFRWDRWAQRYPVLQRELDMYRLHRRLKVEGKGRSFDLFVRRQP